MAVEAVIAYVITQLHSEAALKNLQQVVNNKLAAVQACKALQQGMGSLEQFLTIATIKEVNPTSAAGCVLPPDDTRIMLSQELYDFIKKREKINGIKQIRMDNSLGLKESKLVYEAFEHYVDEGAFCHPKDRVKRLIDKVPELETTLGENTEEIFKGLMSLDFLD